MKEPPSVAPPRSVLPLRPIWLRVLAAALVAAIMCAWWLLPVLLEAAYAGTASPWLNRLIDGRDVHPLGYYAAQLRIVLTAATLATVPLVLLAGLWSFEQGRRATTLTASMIAGITPLLLALITGGWFVFRMVGSLQLPYFGDAAEKVVAAWMISSGGHLYGDVFAHHGPLIYLIGHLVHLLTESTEMAPYRLAQWGLASLALIALAAGKVLDNWRQRLLAVSLLAFTIATLYPEWKGHELLYSINVGLFVSIALSLWLLPLLLGRSVPAYATALGAAMIPCIVGSGYPYALPVVLMVAGCALVLYADGQLRRHLAVHTSAAMIGLGVGALVLLAWLIAFGDLKGYAAYHLYLNQTHYADITGFRWADGVLQLARLAEPRFAWALLAVVLLPIWLLRGREGTKLRLADAGRRLSWAGGMFLIVLGLLYLNPRDQEGFKVAALQLPAATILAIMLARALAPRGRRHGTATNLAALVTIASVICLAAFTPFLGSLSESQLEIRRQTARAERAAAQPLIARVDALLDPGEPILVLTFLPRWYLLAKRLPATGQYYYLPAQAEYERTPLWGHRMDLCTELKDRRVRVVLLHDYELHGSYRLADFAPCVAELLQKDYEVVYSATSEPSIPVPVLLGLKVAGGYRISSG